MRERRGEREREREGGRGERERERELAVCGHCVGQASIREADKERQAGM